MVDETKCASCLIEETGEYIDELKSRCIERMFSREYSWKAKHPFKVMSFVNSMTWRMFDMSSAALTLLKQDNIVPSLCLIRACWENMVATYELTNLIIVSCENQLVDKYTGETLQSMLFSNRYDRDNKYVGEEHFEQFKDYKAKNIITLVQKIGMEFPYIKDVYATVCEFVHPNHDGVLGSYSYLDEPNHTVEFGPQFTQESWLFPASVETLKCSIHLYLKFIISIEEHIEEFTQLCENFLADKGEELSDNEEVN